MSEPTWIDADLIVKLHSMIITETGGADGIRSLDLLESALERPKSRFFYEGLDDLVELAATYAVAISSNHPFIDGNKRAAFMSLGQFLSDNGLELEADGEEATDVMYAVADGRVGIALLVEWLGSRVIAAAV